MRLGHERGGPWVARGSGSGLSGGALPHEEGVLIALSRLRHVSRAHSNASWVSSRFQWVPVHSYQRPVEWQNRNWSAYCLAKARATASFAR